MQVFDKIALALVIIGAINWGLVGLFSFDFVGWLFGGQGEIVSRIIFTVVGLCGLVVHQSPFPRQPRND